MTRVLIFTPTWVKPDGELAMNPECRAAIEAQQVAGGYEHRIGLHNPHPIGSHQNVLAQYQRIREEFLAGQWECLLTIEHDNVLPDALAVQRLLDTLDATRGDVIYAPYMLRHGAPTLSTWQWINSRNLGMSLSHYPRELERARQATIWRISGCGMGCTLFTRRAIEMIPFEASAALNPCPDLGFAEKALRAGLQSYGRFDVPVLHIDGTRRLHPYEREAAMIYVALRSGRVVVGGNRYLKLTAGEEIELTDYEAKELAGVGYVQLPPKAEEPIETSEADETETVDPPAPKKRGRKSKAA